MPGDGEGMKVYSWGETLVLVDVRDKLDGLRPGSRVEMVVGAGELAGLGMTPRNWEIQKLGIPRAGGAWFLRARRIPSGQAHPGR